MYCRLASLNYWETVEDSDRRRRQPGECGTGVRVVGGTGITGGDAIRVAAFASVGDSCTTAADVHNKRDS